MIYDYLYTHMGCLQCNLFLTFDPVPVASYWGYPSWHNAVRSTSNLQSELSQSNRM